MCKMGCVNSKTDINDIHPNIFEVINIDDFGRLISEGQLELTETEVVLYQRGRTPTRWPLGCLRKYGFDSEIFSFECGRRCTTGAGVYAFKCHKAEQLFNVLQQYIQLRNINDERSTDLPRGSSGSSVHRRVPSLSDGYLNPTSAPVKPHAGFSSRPSSVTSTEPVSPVSPTAPVFELPAEHNNNQRGSLIARSYTNAAVVAEQEASPSYINITENHVSKNLYINVATDASLSSTKDMPNNDMTDTYDKLPINSIPEVPSEDEGRHCYENIDTTQVAVPQEVVKTVMTYAVLDLQEKAEVMPNRVSLQPTLESSNKNENYCTIDFHKTKALSQFVNPSIEVEEGSRRTRHNSTISDVTRHSNSISD